MNWVGLHKALERNSGLSDLRHPRRRRRSAVSFKCCRRCWTIPSARRRRMSCRTPRSSSSAATSTSANRARPATRSRCGRSCRGQTVRTVLALGRIRVRPAVSLGLEAYGARPAARSAASTRDAWHRMHMTDPRAVVPASIMPAYPWLAERPASASGDIQARLRALRRLGHPYSDEVIEAAPAAARGQDRARCHDRVLASRSASSRATTPEEHAGH